MTEEEEEKKDVFDAVTWTQDLNQRQQTRRSAPETNCKIWTRH